MKAPSAAASFLALEVVPLGAFPPGRSSTLGILLVLGALGLLMLGVRALQARALVGPEMSRKLVHLGMGSICLAFPWIFNSPRPVWLLAALAVAALAAVRVVAPLRVRFGGVLGGVGRASWGELYFPIAVASVFALARGEAAIFCVPIAILTYADAAGALVGERWGRRRYPAVESTKSLEGSAAVFAVTWLCASALLVGLAGADIPRALLVGFIMGLFAALVEAVSWRGLDNLLLPIVALSQVHAYAELTARDLIGRAVVMLSLAIFMLNWRRQLLDSSARLAAALALYLFWSLGDWRWLIAPTLLLTSYARLMPTIPGGAPRHNLAAVVCIASAGIVWALGNGWERDPAWLALYTLGLATQQAIIAAVRFSQGRPRWRRWQWWLVATVQAVAVQGVGFVAANGQAGISASELGVGCALVGLALAGFMIWERTLELPEGLNARWWRQGLTAVIVPAVGFVGFTFL